MTAVTVPTRALSASDEAALVRLPGLTPYGRPTWLRALEAHFHGETGYVLVRDGRGVQGAWPFAIRRRQGIRLVESLPADGYGGPAVAATLGADDVGPVVEALERGARGLGDVLQWTPAAWLPGGAAPRLQADARALEYPIAVKALAGLGDEGALLASYGSSHRRSVKRAQGATPLALQEAASVADFTAFADLQRHTMARRGLGAKFSTGFVVDAGRALVAAGDGRLLLAWFEGRLAAGLFLLEDATSVYYWLGATTSDRHALAVRPSHALFHRALVDAVAAGRSHFEFGGIREEGLRDFKLGWGAATHTQRVHITPTSALGRVVDVVRRWRGAAPRATR